eukprot:SAG11_NODE_7612_length_1121_cov_1.174168_1_plen_57_part_00
MRFAIDGRGDDEANDARHEALRLIETASWERCGFVLQAVDDPSAYVRYPPFRRLPG